MSIIANVDDVPAQRYATTRVLRDAGYTVFEGGEGNDALVLSHREALDALVLDVDLPDTNGFEIVRKLRSDASTRRLPIVLISAVFTDPEMVREGFRAGATAFLNLPLDPAQLLKIVGDLVGPPRR